MKTMTPEQASSEYIRLEKEFDHYGELIKRDPRQQYQRRYMKKRKQIREKQNLIYPIMVGTGFVEITQDILGMSPKLQCMYKRYKRGLDKNKIRGK